MHKICFGVFASISHEFMLNQSQKADEIAKSIQSAFRVISLNKPDIIIIMKSLLKSEGIKSYSYLSEQIFKFFQMIQNEKPEGSEITNMMFSMTYSDVKLIVKSIVYLTKELWEKEKTRLPKPHKSGKYNIEEKSKNDLLEELNKEDQEIELERELKLKLEKMATMKSLEMFVVQRYTYDWYILRQSVSPVLEINVEQEIRVKT